MADAISQNVVSMDSLAFLSITKRPFAKKIQTLKSKFIWLGISERGGVLDGIKVMTTFIYDIKDK